LIKFNSKAKTDLQHGLGEALMGFWSNIFGKGGSYFLDDEVAKSMGDTEYMKQSKTVRRTFPGAAGEEEFEVIKQVSAIDRSTFDGRESNAPRPTATPSYQSSSSSSFGNSSFGAASFGGATPSNVAPAAAPAESQPEEVAAPAFQPRRDTKVNTDMDMFRNMAKKVGR
jgi:hypothetical protein